MHHTQAQEVIDASFLSVRELCTFLEKEMDDALKENILFSVHLKATMMKVWACVCLLCIMHRIQIIMALCVT
ncbi:hypothetical protein EON63_21220 [archaeon]|nr:MAG: hypothetical protein EON63_21220 [archaeon]